jgi:hypothetical protein
MFLIKKIRVDGFKNPVTRDTTDDFLVTITFGSYDIK